MSNKNANVDIEAVEKHELTPTPHHPPRGSSPGGQVGGNSHSISPHVGKGGYTAKPLDNDNESNSPPLSTPKETEDCDVGYITQIDKDGNIQQVPMKFEGEAEDEPNPLADFMSGKHRFFTWSLGCPQWWNFRHNI